MRPPRRPLVRAASVLAVAAVLALGGAAVSQAVDAPSPSPSTGVETARETPDAEEPVEAEHDETAGEAAEAERKAERGAAKAERKAERGAAKAERKAEREAAKAERRAGPRATEEGTAPAEAPGFVCDPSKNHGQNVSAYARSLPKGPGRGRQVSAAARSDCGQPPR